MMVVNEDFKHLNGRIDLQRFNRLETYGRDSAFCHSVASTLALEIQVRDTKGNVG